MVKEEIMVKGVDISSVQGNVDFKWLVSQGIQFVIVKCYEGNKGKDPYYDKNVAGAKAAGLKVAAYHFVYPLPTTAGHLDRDPKAQAKKHFEAAGNIPFACCDLEWPEPQDWAKWGCTAPQIKQWTLDYLQEYERLSGQVMVLYTYYFYAKTLNLPVEFAKYPLWIANFSFPPLIPKPWTNYAMQQTGGGLTGVAMKLPNGIPVDTDLANDLSLWNARVIPTPEVPPVPEPVPVPDGPQGPQDTTPGANGPSGPDPVPPLPIPPLPIPPTPPAPPSNPLNALIQLFEGILKLLRLK